MKILSKCCFFLAGKFLTLFFLRKNPSESHTTTNGGSGEQITGGNRSRKTSTSILSGSSTSSLSNPENYVSRLQNATTNVMGRISGGLGRGVSGFGGMAGGIANKFLNNL